MVNERRCPGNSRVVLKIDFEKAYDQMDRFLDHAFKREGFSPKGRLWILRCLSLASFTILMNDGCAKGC